MRQEDSFHDLGSGAEKADGSPILRNRVVLPGLGRGMTLDFLQIVGMMPALRESWKVLHK